MSGFWIAYLCFLAFLFGLIAVWPIVYCLLRRKP